MKEQNFVILFLLLLLLFYLIMAGFLFEALESDTEVKRIRQFEELYDNLQKENNISTNLMTKIRLVIAQSSNLGVTSTSQRNWDFAGSFYFAWTVMTTIGFGNVAPVTFGGKVVVIIFALTSIPSYVLLMNMLLETCVTLLKTLLNKIHRCLPFNDLTNQELNMLPVGRIILLTSFLFLLFTVFIAFMFSIIEGWSYFEGIYFVVVATTTVGLGDYAPSKYEEHYNKHLSYRLLNWIVLMFGLIIAYVIINLTATVCKNVLVSISEKINSALPFINIYKETGRDISDTKKNKDASKTSLQSKNPKKTSVTSLPYHEETLALGSFAAIQRAIDRIRQKHENGEVEEVSELKAVNTIEAILQGEYRKTQLKQSDDPAARWRRTASRARIQARRKISNVYKSMLDPDYITSISFGLPTVQKCSSSYQPTLAVPTEVEVQKKLMSTNRKSFVFNKRSSRLDLDTPQYLLMTDENIKTDKSPSMPCIFIEDYHQSSADRICKDVIVDRSTTIDATVQKSGRKKITEKPQTACKQNKRNNANSLIANCENFKTHECAIDMLTGDCNDRCVLTDENQNKHLSRDMFSPSAYSSNKDTFSNHASSNMRDHGYDNESSLQVSEQAELAHKETRQFLQRLPKYRSRIGEPSTIMQENVIHASTLVITRKNGKVHTLQDRNSLI